MKTDIINDHISDLLKMRNVSDRSCKLYQNTEE